MKKTTKNTIKEEEITKNEEFLVENTTETGEKLEVGTEVILEQSDIDENYVLKEAGFQEGDKGTIISKDEVSFVDNSVENVNNSVEPDVSIYKKSTRSGDLCIPCSFEQFGEILTPQEAVTEGLLTEAEMLAITK
jgi:hypothetical protein